MKTGACIIALAIALAGCVAPRAPLPKAAESVVLVPVSSASVTVRQPALQMSAGRLQLTGFVVKVYEAKTTEQTHLDVVFFDSANRTIAERTASFAPQRLTSGRRSPSRQGHYALELAELPTGTARVEIRAHDSAHSSNS